MLSEEEYELVDIENITKEVGEFELIDIDVDEDSTFCITNDDIISHNCKSMMRTLTYRAAKSNTTILFTNHIYDNPATMYPTLIKSQSGGKGPLYLASILIQLSASQTKEEEGKIGNEIIPFANKVSGVTLNAMTVKNRFIPPFLKTSLELNFKTGLYRYSGLLEMAIGYGILIKKDRTYELPDGTKLGYEKNFKDDIEIWEKIIPILDEKLKKELKFSTEETLTLTKEVEECIVDN